MLGTHFAHSHICALASSNTKSISPGPARLQALMNPKGAVSTSAAGALADELDRYATFPLYPTGKKILLNISSKYT